MWCQVDDGAGWGTVGTYCENGAVHHTTSIDGTAVALINEIPQGCPGRGGTTSVAMHRSDDGAPKGGCPASTLTAHANDRNETSELQQPNRPAVCVCVRVRVRRRAFMFITAFKYHEWRVLMYGYTCKSRAVAARWTVIRCRSLVTGATST
jgi:hypothetical protein